MQMAPRQTLRLIRPYENEEYRTGYYQLLRRRHKPWHWDRDLAGLAERFGVVGLPTAKTPGDAAIRDWLPLPILNEALATVRIRGADYEGFWRSTRPSGELKGMYLHDHILLKKAENGLLRFHLGVFDIRFEGFALPLQHQLFGIATDIVSGTFIFLIVNGVARQKAEVLDGISLTCMRDAGGTPLAGKVLLERIGDLSGDDAADAATHAEMMTRNPVSPPDAIPAPIRDHLFHDIGPTAWANGGDPMLMITLATSLARGPGFEMSRAV